MTSTLKLATRSQKIAAMMKPFLARHKAWILSYLTGYMFCCCTNAVSDPKVEGFVDLVKNIYDTDRQVNAISWICSIIIVVLLALNYWVKWQSRKTRTIALLSNLVDRNIDSIVAPFSRDTVAWGTDLTLQLAPDLQNDWPLEKVELRLDGLNFQFPKNRKADYERFKKDNWNLLGFDQDGTKYALVKNPSAFSDASNLTLQIMKTKYSEVRYFGQCIATVKPERDKLIEEVMHKGQISFPNSLCMHAVVVTSDRRVLLTQRSHKVSYSPGTWSVSVEEQLSPDDLRGGTRGATKRWARRLLLEELAVERGDYDERKFRLLSVFLEADTLNCSVCAIMPIDMTSKELETQLKVKPRTDYEFSDWKFMDYAELADELSTTKLLQHPSTGYRIFMALAHRFGAARLADVVFSEVKCK